MPDVALAHTDYPESMNVSLECGFSEHDGAHMVPKKEATKSAPIVFSNTVIDSLSDILLPG